MFDKIKAIIPGRLTKAEFKKDYKERNGAIVTKITRGVFRFGLNAQNLKHYDHKGNGLPEGSKWVNFPLLLKNKKEELKVRFYPSYNPNQKPKS